MRETKIVDQINYLLHILIYRFYQRIGLKVSGGRTVFLRICCERSSAFNALRYVGCRDIGYEFFDQTLKIASKSVFGSVSESVTFRNVFDIGVDRHIGFHEM